MSKASGRSTRDLATEASLNAIDDAGLIPSDIDGVISYYWANRDSPAPYEIVDALGLTHCNLSCFDSSGGSWGCSAVSIAASAIYAGICRHVLVYKAWNGRTGFPGFGGIHAQDHWPTGARQWNEPFGADHPATFLGPHVTAYMSRYGVTNRDFAHVSVQQRQHASLNRKAMLRKPVTVEDHQNSGWIVQPFRLLDCSITTDGSMALVVSAAEDSRHMRHSSVTITAMLGGGVGRPIQSRLSINPWELNASVLAPELYRRAGITANDLDLAELYDPFTGICLLHVEAFGLAPAGRAAACFEAGEMSLDGRIPVNTHGGHLSEAGMAGMGHLVEAVQQLRSGGVCDDFCYGPHDYNRANCRQVRDPELALVCSETGDSALILKRSS